MNPYQQLRGCLSRRDFLRISAASVAATSMSGWLHPLAAGAASSRVQHKSCIVLWLAGGLSQMESFDLKEYSYYKPIQTSVPGIQVCEALPKLAPLMKHAAIIRSMSTPENDHLRAAYHTHTGHRPIAGGTVFPSIGAVVSKELGQPDFPLPSYAVIAGGKSLTRVNKGTQSGYLGSKHSPLLIKDPKLGVENLKPSGDLRQFDQRMNLLKQVEEGFYKIYPVTPAEAHLTTLQGAAQMMQSKEARAYDISLEPAANRAAYGGTGYGDACLLARRLVEVGLPFIEVSLPEWDNHSGFIYHKQNLPPLDSALSALINDLKDRGLLEQTLVVVMGEFGRGGTGRVGPDAKSKEDRGHWHRAWSTLLVGGGIKGGQVVGRTDKIAATVEDRPVSIADFFATICKLIGVDYTKEYTEPGGRPIRIVDKGEKLITELL